MAGNLQLKCAQSQSMCQNLFRLGSVLSFLERIYFYGSGFDGPQLSLSRTYVYTVCIYCIYCIYIFICIYKLCLYDSFTLLWWAQLQRTLGQGISPVSYFGPSAEERRPNSSFNPQAQFGGRILCSLPANQHRRPSFDGVGGDSRRLPPATRHTSGDCIFSVRACVWVGWGGCYKKRLLTMDSLDVCLKLSILVLTRQIKSFADVLQVMEKDHQDKNEPFHWGGVNIYTPRKSKNKNFTC